jgi:hypothetical protein
MDGTCNISAGSFGGAGIGSGYAEDGNSAVSEMEIFAGDILASGSYGAGIGSGSGERNSSVVPRMISGGKSLEWIGRRGYWIWNRIWHFRWFWTVDFGRK